MHNPLVSIIIPTHNTGRFIEKAIKSIQDNNYENIEILCVDNSTDDTPAIIQNLADKDPRIKIVKQTGKGIANARNEGIKASVGKYLYYVDSDDEIKNDTLQTCVSYLEENNADIICCNADLYLNNKRMQTIFGADYFKKQLLICQAKDYEHSVIFTNTWQCLIKREFLMNNNILFPEGVLYEDWIFMVNVFVKNPYCVFIKKSFYNYYDHKRDDQLTYNVTTKCLDSLKAYWISKEMIRACNLNPYWDIVNDKKVFNFSSDFIYKKLLKSNNYSVIIMYFDMLREIIQNMNPLYFYSLIRQFSTIQIIILLFIKEHKKINKFNLACLKTRLFIQKCIDKINWFMHIRHIIYYQFT